ncbi:hypothetical protein BC826DRAFT_659125 [Russula brevipes]|nr:hypothetical protein BC826DRAFT_659125 [Russula brevipes]
MATVPQSPTTPPPQSNPYTETSKTSFDYPGADITLRSCDSPPQDFRVLKVFITESSPILRKRIQAIANPSHTATSAGAEDSLPIVELSDNATILSSLLTFIFPVSPVLPTTLEETMELLSVAQKYEMHSVMAHVRGCISLRDPPFIRPDNAFRAFSFAQKYGLRHESARAARTTLKFSLTIENLEGKIDAMPGAYLHELQKYHQSVQSNLVQGIDNFRGSFGRGSLTGLQCIALSASGIPRWLDDYTYSVAWAPSGFDHTEFQKALARHLKDQTIHTFWMALTDFFNENILEAESTLSIVGSGAKIYPQDHTPAKVVLPLPEYLYINEADVIIQSCGGVNFRAHKTILASSSQFFRDMFSLPQPSNEVVNGLPVLCVSEDTELVRALITMMYPIPPEIPGSYDRIIALLAASEKYDMPAIQHSIRAEVSYRRLSAKSSDQAFRAYTIASKNRLSPETGTAAYLTLDYPLTFESLGSELERLEGWALHDLVSFRKLCQNDMVSCFESFLDIGHGPSRIWANCPGSKSQYGKPALPSWLDGLFTAEIAILKQNFAKAVIQPSSIRDKYLAALKTHAIDVSGERYRRNHGCTFCLEVHASQGEIYCKELEEKLTRARDREPRILVRRTSAVGMVEETQKPLLEQRK